MARHALGTQPPPPPAIQLIRCKPAHHREAGGDERRTPGRVRHAMPGTITRVFNWAFLLGSGAAQSLPRSREKETPLRKGPVTLTLTLTQPHLETLTTTPRNPNPPNPRYTRPNPTLSRIQNILSVFFFVIFLSLSVPARTKTEHNLLIIFLSSLESFPTV